MQEAQILERATGIIKTLEATTHFSEISKPQAGEKNAIFYKYFYAFKMTIDHH